MPEENEVSRVDELGDIFDKANAEEAEVNAETTETEVEPTPAETVNAEEGQPRDESGRFTKKEEAPTETVEAAPEEIPEPLAAPMDLPEDLAAHWGGMDRGLQLAIIDQITNLNQSATETSSRLQALDPITAAIEPMRQTLQMNGMTDAQYVQSLVAADQMLRTQPQQALQWIMRNYGISPDSQGEDFDEIDPSIAPLANEVQQLKNTLASLQQQSQQSETAQTQAQIEAFAKDHPHFETVRTTMSGLLNAGAAQDMQSAYDMAVHANPATRAAVQAEQVRAAEEKRKAEAAEKAAKASEIAASNLSTEGTTSGDPPIKFANRADELAHVYDQIQGAA